MKLTGPIAVTFADQTQERVRLNHEIRLTELQGLLGVNMKVVKDVALVNATPTLVAHNLGRPPKITLLSPPKGAVTVGLISEFTAGNPDPDKFVVLHAGGMGATVFVDVLFL